MVHSLSSYSLVLTQVGACEKCCYWTGYGHRNRKLGSQERSTTVATDKEKIHMVVIWLRFSKWALAPIWLSFKIAQPSPHQYCGPLHINHLLCMHTYTHASRRLYPYSLTSLKTKSINLQSIQSSGSATV